MPCTRPQPTLEDLNERSRSFDKQLAPAREFAKLWYKEKQQLSHDCFDTASDRRSLVSVLIERMGLTAEQRLQLMAVIDCLLDDTMYTLLLGLDGSANIGGVQETYRIYREDGVLISNCGELEAAAYEVFHEKSP